MNFDCENICVKRCAGPCQGEPTRPSPAVTFLLGLVSIVLALSLLFFAVWAVARAAGLDDGS